MSDERFINRTTFEDGREVTSHYDKKTGLIFETVGPQRGSLLDDPLFQELLRDADLT